MRYLKYLQRVGLVSSLLIGGVLGGLMAPLSSEALTAPTLTIDGVAVNDLVLYGDGCGTMEAPNDPSFNFCYSIPNTNVTTEATRSSTRQIGAWYVGDYSASNQARVLIASNFGSNDDIKLTGATFTPVVAAGTKVTHVIIGVTLDNGGGRVSGATTNYYWSESQGGNFDPPAAENVVNNRLKLTGTGTFVGVNNNSTSGNLGILDTGIFTSPTLRNTNGVVSRSLAATIVNVGCDTGGGKCAPPIVYDYEITVVGGDTLNLTDSVGGCGGTCDEYREGEGGPPLCADVLPLCDDVSARATVADVTEGLLQGGVLAETCLNTCIIITFKATPRKDSAGVTFSFPASGQGVATFSLKANADGYEDKTFSNLDPDNMTMVDERVFAVPTSNKGTWQADNIVCVSKLKDGSTTWAVDGTSDKGPLHVLTLGTNDILTCNMHLHR